MNGTLNGESRVSAVKVFSTTEPGRKLEDLSDVMSREIGILRYFVFPFDAGYTYFSRFYISSSF